LTQKIFENLKTISDSFVVLLFASSQIIIAFFAISYFFQIKSFVKYVPVYYMLGAAPLCTQHWTYRNNFGEIRLRLG